MLQTLPNLCPEQLFALKSCHQGFKNSGVSQSQTLPGAVVTRVGIRIFKKGVKNLLFFKLMVQTLPSGQFLPAAVSSCLVILAGEILKTG